METRATAAAGSSSSTSSRLPAGSLRIAYPYRHNIFSLLFFLRLPLRLRLLDDFSFSSSSSTEIKSPIEALEKGRHRVSPLADSNALPFTTYYILLPVLLLLLLVEAQQLIK